jgi:diguanylate cyclase (GGDEF)-like protein/PAS domain S-box-containing protein
LENSDHPQLIYNYRDAFITSRSPTTDPEFVTDLLCTLDQSGRIIHVNDAWHDGLGYSNDELRGMPLARLCADDDCTVMANEIDRLSSGATSVTFECRIRGRNGAIWFSWHFTRNSQNDLSHGIGRDISRQKHTEQVLAYQIYYDIVTGLPNRHLFNDRLEQEVIAAQAAHTNFALCVIDLDRFNQINDMLGHLAGDEVLAFIALRLRSIMGQQALLARLGGDEFGLILRDVYDTEDALARARRILAVIEQPFPLQSQELFLSASIGISLFPKDGSDAATLLNNANNAMYRVKENGRNGVSLFDPAIGAVARKRLDIALQMRRAIDLDQFELHYQPLLDMHSGRVVAVEALIRWRHPDQGVIMPGEFIDVAEENNLIERLSRWGIVAACRQAISWQQAGKRPLRMSVNVSAPQFERADIVDRVTDALRASGLDSQWLELEITESVLMRDPQESVSRIRRLAGMGVQVALDDFGTGYSSLAYLQRFPVRRLKIDRSFVWALGPNPNADSDAAALLRAITSLAQILKLKVVAEGIESPGQHQFLTKLGCDEGQGFLYARPTSAESLWDVIAELEG